MHPASPFIKPKYFKTRVKERKARAAASLFTRNDGCCWLCEEAGLPGKSETFYTTKEQEMSYLRFPCNNIDFITERNNSGITFLDLGEVARFNPRHLKKCISVAFHQAASNHVNGRSEDQNSGLFSQHKYLITLITLILMSYILIPSQNDGTLLTMFSRIFMDITTLTGKLDFPQR